MGMQGENFKKQHSRQEVDSGEVQVLVKKKLMGHQEGLGLTSR